MPHSTSATRQPTPPTQLTLLEGMAGWRDPSPRAQRQRERDRERARQRIITQLRAENDATVAENDRLQQLRDDVAAEKEILASIITAQETILAEIAALAIQKPMAIDELADELRTLIGTDHPHNLARRLNGTSLDSLLTRLWNNNLYNVAEQLKKPLKKPPAPYPTHATQRARRARKPVDNGG